MSTYEELAGARAIVDREITDARQECKSIREGFGAPVSPEDSSVEKSLMLVHQSLRLEALRRIRDGLADLELAERNADPRIAHLL